MARARGMLRTLRERDELVIHEDAAPSDDEETLEESKDPLEESQCTNLDESDGEVDEAVVEEMQRFQAQFKGIAQRYRLINRIGEGTFSTVYKAEDLFYNSYRNDWDVQAKDLAKWTPPKRRHRSTTPHYVAIKKIYATSSPHRILNELELLHDLRDSDSVCPLITAFRHQDQVIAILPYFQHLDFREYYREMTVSNMRLYFQSLFTALRAVHSQGILHRDIKPTNFLYSPLHNRGVLVDFGLAERQGYDTFPCLCELSEADRQRRIEGSVYAARGGPDTAPSYPKTDNRPGRRANRAGTRGFRAPEVLLKCTAQTTAIDMWSAGVILLTMLTKRFPFFHSADDVDALLELTYVFGKRRMREAAILHGQVFQTNIPSYDSGIRLERVVRWSTARSERDANKNYVQALSDDEVEAIRFLELLLECDPDKRITAKEALRHPFITAAGKGDEEDDEMDLIS
ncbi:kinase-like domain-containing protein [Lineolata rhizophorae]|uniref:non-specific serine/threonine protein kinase n=1 Tax=Lineolata rhizophorae TaxID=578093 RepID=A0A6A6P0H4_9PEZI|nr:kinase-like domain-containing protein [Lineolata rhizophorae]